MSKPGAFIDGLFAHLKENNRQTSFTPKEQNKIVRGFIASGLDPVTTLLCITSFLSYVDYCKKIA